MNQPSNLTFTAGVVFFILNAGAIFGCAYKFSQAAAQLVTEYVKSREVNQDKQE
jgi:cation transport regulator ChaC